VDNLVFDTHTHILPDEFRRDRAGMVRRDRTFAALFGDGLGRTASAEELATSMDANGVGVSVAAGYGWTDLGVARLANDYALEAAERYRGRVVPFCSAPLEDPRAAVAEVARCARAGARGMGELHFDTQLPGSGQVELSALAPLMDAAREMGLVTLVHASEPVGHSYPGKGAFTPDRALTLAQAFPRNRFILAHFGGGLPFYALMPEVRKALANVWFDSAAQPFIYRPAAFTASAVAAGEGRLLFGSDFPLLPQRRALLSVRRSGLASQALDAVLGGNAAALFGQAPA
jgi:hypothetical protein